MTTGYKIKDVADRSGFSAATLRYCEPRWLLSSLLIAGAALFAIGVTSERSGEDDHGSSESAAEVSNEQATEAGEAAEEGEGDNEAAEGSAEAAEGSEESEESEEGLFGVNLESPVFVVLGVAASLVLAVLTWRSNARRLLIVTGLFAAVFAVLDVAEAVRKFNDSETGIAILAMTIGVIHAAAAFVADQRLSTTKT